MYFYITNDNDMKAKILTVTIDSQWGTGTNVFTNEKAAAKYIIESLKDYSAVRDAAMTALKSMKEARKLLSWASENELLDGSTFVVDEHEIEVPNPQVGRFVGVLDIPRSTVRLAVRMFIATFCMQGRICIPEHGISTGMPATGAFDEHFFYLEDIADGAGEAEFDNLSQPDRLELEALMKQVADAGCWWVRFTE